jgi:phosphoglycerate dehydrogenase-like enzyme
MTSRPTVVLAMVPLLTPQLFTPVLLDRLRGTCDVPDPEPLTAFADDRAADLLPRADVLLTGWGCPRIGQRVLARAPRLRAIVHAAGTVKDHVTAACWERDLQVSSAAAANAVPVAEYTLAAILFANKRVFRLQRRYAETRAFTWGAREFPGLGNFRKTIGVVGASRIGRRVIELLRPFDFDVQVYDPYLSAAEAVALGARSVALDDLLRTSDVVTLHAPAVAATKHVIDRARLALLRDGTTLINTARGWLVDGEALTAELVSGRIDAVIDTTEPEVLPPDSPLYDLPNVVLTPHIAGAMGTETQRMAALAIDEIERFAAGLPFQHGVKREDWDRIA